MVQAMAQEFGNSRSFSPLGKLLQVLERSLEDINWATRGVEVFQIRFHIGAGEKRDGTLGLNIPW
jgi:hypothetical protein